MVLLRMTATMVAAIQKDQALEEAPENRCFAETDPPLLEPKVGNPISHGQVVAISKGSCDRVLSQQGSGQSWTLDELLRGSEVYTPPTEPKPEHTSEYKALMARLRREEEARQYERMTSAESDAGKNTPGFNTRVKPSTIRSRDEDDEMTFADVNRQITLIINVLVSIVTCGIAIWLAASHWSAPKRLALSMGGSIVVAVAEVVIYAGYIQRLMDAKSKEKGKKEKKYIKDTWIIEQSRPSDLLPMPTSVRGQAMVRHRKVPT